MKKENRLPHYNKLKETAIKSRRIHTGVVSFNEDTVRLLNGETSTRLYTVHPGASAVLAVKNGKIVLVQQYRYPVKSVTWELPAGKKEKGQTPLECAKREFQEETGLKPGKLKKLFSFFPGPAFSDEVLHIYFTDDWSEGQTHRDADEFLNVKLFTVKEALKMLHSGKIKDSKTIIALSLYENTLLKKGLLK